MTNFTVRSEDIVKTLLESRRPSIKIPFEYAVISKELWNSVKEIYGFVYDYSEKQQLKDAFNYKNLNKRAKRRLRGKIKGILDV